MVFVLLENHVLPRAFSLTESFSNNVTKYNALLIDLQLTQQTKIQYLEGYGDSKLIVNQVKEEHEVRHEDLIPYHHATIKSANSFNGFYIAMCIASKIQRQMLQLHSRLHWPLPADTTYHLTVTAHHLFCPKYGLEVNEVHITSINFE